MLTPEEYELVVRFLNDDLDEAQAVEFRRLLQANPAARKALRDFAMIDTKLSEISVAPPMLFDLSTRPPESSAGGMSHGMLADKSSPIAAGETSGSVGGASWLKLGSHFAVRAAIFWILLGVIGSSVGWAIAVPRWVGAGKLYEIFRESFESTAAPVALHVPNAPGHWSGDYTEIVAEQLEVTPSDGERMLSFLRADYDSKVEAGSSQPSHTSDVYYMFDMRPYSHLFAEGGCKLRLSAMFNSKKLVNGEHYRGGLAMAALPQRVLKEYPKLNDAILMTEAAWFTRSTRLNFDEQPEVWQQLSEEMPLPWYSHYVVIRISVAHATPKQRKVSFEGLFLDEVRLSLVVPNKPSVFAAFFSPWESLIGMNDSKPARTPKESGTAYHSALTQTSYSVSAHRSLKPVR